MSARDAFDQVYAALAWERQVDDIYRFSLPTLLRYEDRNSMGNSMESRLPLMDYRLVEFGVALPEAVKLRRGYGKWIVREAMKGRIPESIRVARYKRGFDVSQT
jgi:asparagine synthase (glutamine-hydrolysing)